MKFSMETLKTRSQWTNIFKILSGNYFQPNIHSIDRTVLECRAEEFGVYCIISREPLNIFEQGNNLIRIMCRLIQQWNFK